MDYEESPCQGLCDLDENRVCRGCGRTNVEIASWRVLDLNEKKQVWERLEKQGIKPKEFE